MRPYDGVVLAGGRARRMGGAPKPVLEVGGRRLLDVALDALHGARRVVVVGDVAVPAGVVVTREEPAGSGPVAALAAALPLVEQDLCVVLAADLPFVTAAHVAQLVAAVDGRSAVAVDAEGREQPLLAAYDVAALRAALPDELEGAPMRLLVDRLERQQVQLEGDPWFDCDEPADLERARVRAGD
jgi:molybdopterin-guanine dinucleotide biosynthesis protein A